MPKARDASPATLSEDDLKRIGAAVESALYRAAYDVIAQVRRDVVDELRFAPLAVELAEARARRDLDLKTAAKMVKVPQYVIQQIERGRLSDLRPGALERLADILGMKDRVGRWKTANPELALRLGRPKGMSPVLAMLEQQALAEYLLKAGSGTASTPANAPLDVVRHGAKLDGKILQLEVVLEEVQPPIWRRLQVHSTTTLEELHGIIQTVMGWTDSHLYMFEIGGIRYCDFELMDDPNPEDRDARETRLADLRLARGTSFHYEYDFGDGWTHRITVEQIVDATGATAPRCLGGERACPPEDSGGAGGYEELLAIIADASHPEHGERRRWAGKGFDPERFDAGRVNSLLARRGRRKK
jgi:hypothetical protein